MSDAKKIESNEAVKRRQLQRRRRLRQLLGALVCLFVIIGITSTVTSGINLVGIMFDDTEEKLAYEERLKYLVALDPLPFENLASAPTETLLYSAMYRAIDGQSSSDYETNEFGEIYLPISEIDVAAKSIFGPDESFNYVTFTVNGLLLNFDVEHQAYIMPVTSPSTEYAPIVTELNKQGGTVRVTVGYDMPYDTVIEAVKYLDYIFEEHEDGNTYLVAIVASETQPETQVESDTTAQTAQSVPTDNEQLLDNAGDGILTESAQSAAASETQVAQDVPQAEGEAAPAEGEAAPTEGEAAPTEGEAAPTEGEAEPTE